MTVEEAKEALLAYLNMQVGYLPEAGKINKYAAHLDSITGFYNGKKQGADFCDVFADDAYVVCFGAETGRRMIYQPLRSLGAGCKWSALYYEQNGALKDAPEVGDQIFFGQDGDDHTGIVVDIKDGRVYTIEGNTGSDGMVRRKDYAHYDPWIYGYGRPNWSLVADQKQIKPPCFEPKADVIWDFLVKWLQNERGAAGLIGNLDKESGLIPGNLENSKEPKLGMTDREYTAAVDDGIHDFEDGAGYGLAQWTHYDRKRKLLSYCRSQNASVGNLQAQLEYLKKEMEALFPSVFSRLKTTDSVADASDAVMCDFENPANQTEENKQIRRDICQRYYDKYAEGKEDPEEYCEVRARILGIGDTGHAVESLQGALIAHGYDLDPYGGADGIFGAGTERRVKEYQRDHDLSVDGVVGAETWGSLLT